MDTCWRCNGQGASIPHALWSCPALHHWLKTIAGVIFFILSRTFQISPVLSSTTGLPDSHFFSYEKRFCILAVRTAKLILLRYWQQKHPPPYEEWLTTMIKLTCYEKVTYELLDKLDQYVITDYSLLL